MRAFSKNPWIMPNFWQSYGKLWENPRSLQNLACMTWDPTVAAYIAFRILRPAKVMSAAVADKVDQRSWPVSDPRPWPIHARSLPDPQRPVASVGYRAGKPQLRRRNSRR